MNPEIEVPMDELETLRQRAQVLARELEETRTGESLEVVEFLLAGEHYGIESRFVREAFRLREITHMPGAPNWIRGVVNVRSQVLAVVDLRPFLHLGQNPFSDESRLLILQGPLGSFGLLVDGIRSVRLMDLDEIQPAPPEAGVRSEYIHGVTAERLIVLDGDEILGDKRLTVGSEP